MYLRKFTQFTLVGAHTRSLKTICSLLLSKSGSDNKSGSKGVETNKETCQECPSCACPSDFNPSTPSMYDCRKYGHCLPPNDLITRFECLPNFPTGIFRCTTGETLGSGADKGCCYQCPEYFAYQHMTFYDLHLYLRPCRKPSAKTGRKP
ncbi:uncharacterized protein LOC114242127 [Bombyx mandarina]|uniref:Uncharacterized protein LOC114242127 n=1 Tax=Bombyx mandarina TaxID=7092 RepID=A0A6J2JHC9_BOMMA|nr:uncharacterized protein LOC114242127 [Bombyx mandarina]